MAKKIIKKAEINSRFIDLDGKIKNFIGLTNFRSSKDKKRTYNYIDWLYIKTDIIENENNLIIPPHVLPNKISKQYIYNKLTPHEKSIINKAYILGKFDSMYLDKTKTLTNDDVVKLAKILLLRRGNVIWVEYGFNIGKEFGGKHPAIILKSLGDSVIVVPLSSKTPNNKDLSYNEKIEVVKNLPPETRWTNVLRIKMISINRIDFNSRIGWVVGTKLDKISDKLKLSGIITT